MKWNLVKIKECGTIVSGATPKTNIPEYWNGDILWVTPKDISINNAQYISTTSKRISLEGFKSCSAQLLPIGSILFTSRAPIGLLAINKAEMCTNQGFKSIIPFKDKADSNYLYFLLKSKKVYLNSIGNGATFKELSKEIFGNVQIPLPPLPEQIHIANVLSKAEALIAKRKESLALLDAYLKSTFLEMFGDPVRNEKGWDKKRIDEIADSRLGKMRDKQFITGNHLKKYLGNSNVRWFSFDLQSLEEMDFNEDEKIKYSLHYGDLLICEGGEIGRCAIWKNQVTDIYFQKALHRVRVDITKIKQEYLQYVLFRYAQFGGFTNVMNKATIAHLTGEKLKETKIPVPPLELQNQFAAVVEKVEALKETYQESLGELEQLYGSLSQRAFRGELGGGG